MHDTYTRIFTRLGLKFRAVAADTGAIGGTGSHEFHVLADSGEDAIAFCPESDYAANVELAEALAAGERGRRATDAQGRHAGQDDLEEVGAFLKIDLKKTVKAVAVMHDDQKESPAPRARRPHAERGQDAEGLIGALRFATDGEIERALGCKPGSSGPVGAKVLVVADRAVAAMSDFVAARTRTAST